MSQAAGNQSMGTWVFVPASQGAGDQEEGMGQQPVMMMMPMNQGTANQAICQQPMRMSQGAGNQVFGHQPMTVPISQRAGNQVLGQQPMMMVPMSQGAGNLAMGQQTMVMMSPMNQETRQQGPSMIPVNQGSPTADPPSYAAVISTPLDRLPKITESEAKEALINYVRNQACWGTDTAMYMIFQSMRHEYAFHYTLQTYTETREPDTELSFAPYIGQDIDAASEGAGDMWSVVVEPPMNYQDAVKHEEIPNTASVVPCHKCSSTGNIECVVCNGKVMTGCNTCAGNGVMSCVLCEGTCQLKKFQTFSSTWSSYITRKTINKTTLDTSFLSDVTGQVVYEDEQRQLGAISHFEDQEIMTTSQEMIQEHMNVVKRKTIFCQRHKLQAVPVTRVFFMQRGTLLDFHVFGVEKKVYAPLYPERSDCNIL